MRMTLTAAVSCGNTPGITVMVGAVVAVQDAEIGRAHV